MVVVDDARLTDRWSALALRFALRRLGHEPLFGIVPGRFPPERPLELATAEPDVWGRLGAGASVQSLTLPGLDGADLVDLADLALAVTGRRLRPSELDSLLEETDDHPLLARALLTRAHPDRRRTPPTSATPGSTMPGSTHSARPSRARWHRPTPRPSDCRVTAPSWPPPEVADVTQDPRRGEPSGPEKRLPEPGGPVTLLSFSDVARRRRDRPTSSGELPLGEPAGRPSDRATSGEERGSPTDATTPRRGALPPRAPAGPARRETASVGHHPRPQPGRPARARLTGGRPSASCCFRLIPEPSGPRTGPARRRRRRRRAEGPRLPARPCRRRGSRFDRHPSAIEGRLRNGPGAARRLWV